MLFFFFFDISKLLKFNFDFSQTKAEEKIPEVRPTSDEKPPVNKNDSIERALTELSLAEEELSIKPKVEIETNPAINSHLAELIATSSVLSKTDGDGTKATSVSTASVPPSSANIENFYKEVQRYEKIVNGLTTKTLNGTTPLEIKWKELHDLLDKDAAKRTVSVSKLFPEKNRDMLSVPYDHSRVLLPTETDNYINAAHIRVSAATNSHRKCFDIFFSFLVIRFFSVRLLFIRFVCSFYCA